ASLLKGADASLDLMESNPERVLATPTRTSVCLRLGTPAIFNDYSEWSGRFAGGASGTGWAVAPGDRDALRAALRDIAARAVRGDNLPARPLAVASDPAAAAGSFAAWLDQAGLVRTGLD